MAIATLTDLKRLCDSDPARGKPRIGIGDDDVDQLTDATAQSFLDAQEAYIQAYLGFGPVVNALTKEIHGKLTAWHIWIHIIDRSHGEGKIPEYVREWYNWAMKCLDDAKDGTLKITAEDGAVAIRAFSSEFRQVVDEEVTMEHDEYVQLQYYPMIAHSLVVYSAKDQGGTQYTEGTDFKVNYAQAEIKTLSTGSIADQQKVYISYQHIESKQLHKRPERVDYADRSGIPGWSGIFGGRRW